MEIIQEIWQYLSNMAYLEAFGLVFGLLCVLFLIKENILTWPFGIAYVLVSFVIFWEARLYGDLLLHIIFLLLNIYGWYYWISKPQDRGEPVTINKMKLKSATLIGLISIIGIYLFAQFLIFLPFLFKGIAEASLPYWDSTTSVLSVTAMWLTARKYLDNWYYWLVVDILATGIYFYKELFFYSILYMLYIILAVWGYKAWNKTYLIQNSNVTADAP